METLSQRLERVAAKLAEARANGATGFGTGAHQLRLNPPLTPVQLKELESRHGLYLPEEYRAFLLQLGDGGAGPYYGIPPLTTAVEDADLTAEFPLAYPDNTPLPLADLRQGSLQICDQGCSFQGRLVLLGPARGRVVYVDTDESSPPYFVRDETFLDWYERWLDDLISGDLPPWFGFDNPDLAAEPAPSAEPPTAIDIPPGADKLQLERIRAALFTRPDLTTHSAYRPPLSADAIAEINRLHGIVLPAGYAAFLQYVQAGGVGPYYGLTPIEYALPAEDDASRSVYLAHLGLSLYAFLAVSGPAAGRVYYLDTERPDCLPYFVRDAAFLDWYERWLHADSNTFGFDNPAYVTKGNPPKISWKSVESTSTLTPPASLPKS